MHELFSFFVKHSKWFLFALYVALSCTLLVKNSPYQHHLYLTSANAATSAVLSASNSVYSYFNLRSINEDLNQRNAELLAEVVSLRQQLDGVHDQAMADTLVLPDSLRQFDFLVARVISNSVSKPFNYITVNKGSADGVEPEMGVIDQNGVVGIVNVTGEHSSRIISLLNSNLKISCRIRGNSSFGSLVWDGNDPEVALLQELPRHTVFQPGDTVETSGFSAIFPAGIPVGTVLEDGNNTNENFNTLRVKLAAQFTTLSNVQIVLNRLAPELSQLESADAPSKKK